MVKNLWERTLKRINNLNTFKKSVESDGISTFKRLIVLKKLESNKTIIFSDKQTKFFESICLH
jgi:uncharacterized protein (DUF1919 family)